MISCLMVTQAARLPLAALAVGDFARQSHAERELVILHDGGADTDAALRALAALHPGASIRVVAEPPGLSLGALRNRALAAAAGSHVCQWDDDDRYHPERLALQWAALSAQSADFCFLADQLHFFPQTREMYWDDWSVEPYPMDFVQGSLLGRRERMPPYPDLARGEDTAAVRELLRRGHRVARLRDAGWCYVYVCHGGNVWPPARHAAISREKRFGAARLLRHEAMLRRRLADYAPGFGAVAFPHEAGNVRV
jgi:glycosyltransferase involved in cell wall biosynthesis